MRTDQVESPSYKCELQAVFMFHAQLHCRCDSFIMQITREYSARFCYTIPDDQLSEVEGAVVINLF